MPPARTDRISANVSAQTFAVFTRLLDTAAQTYIAVHNVYVFNICSGEPDAYYTGKEFDFCWQEERSCTSKDLLQS